jgi:hypothetical protein
LVLADNEREQLVRRAKSSQASALLAGILLACADGADNKAVAERLGWASGVAGWSGTGSTGWLMSPGRVGRQ